MGLILLCFLVYLLLGLCFKTPTEWKWYTKLFSWIFWLPTVLFLIIIFNFGRR